MEAVERDVFINLVLENPQLTLAELTKLGKGKFAGLLSSVSVGDIIEGGRGRDEGGERLAGRGGKRARTRTRTVNTRTPEGRKAYDGAVLGVVEGAERPLKAPEITEQVGGTALQVRKSLARLIDAGKVTWEGKARGMRYSAV